MTIRNKRTKNILNGLGVLTFVAFLIFYVVDGTAYQKEREEHGCYTVGVTDGFKYAHKQGGLGVYYLYSYQGKEYRRWDIAMDETKYKGGKYLVKLSSKNPKNSDLLVLTPIEGDSIPEEYRPLCSELE